MLRTAVTRIADERFQGLAGLSSPQPSLAAVLGASARAVHQVRHLLQTGGGITWPLPEFQVSMGRDGQEVVGVVGAARPLYAETTVSCIAPKDADGDGSTRFRRLVEASGALLSDWASRSPARDSRVAEMLSAAALPEVPSHLAEAFGPDVLEGRASSRPLGADAAWNRLHELEGYLGRGVIPQELRVRLVESLAFGVTMRGAPADWRGIVRDAVLKRLRLGAGPETNPPLLVSVVASFGSERSGRGGTLPGLLQAEDRTSVRACAMASVMLIRFNREVEVGHSL